MDGLRLSKAELKQQFGISERLAVRVGALCSKGLLVTAALLEETVREESLRKLILDPELLSRAGDMDTHSLQKLSSGASPVGIYEGVLALEEEVLAEKSWGDEKSPGTMALSEKSPPSLLGNTDVESLFSPDELSRLKLTILTGVDSDAKREALRRISLSPLPLEEKGKITLHVLGDADPRVRREAVEALRNLGMDGALSELLSTLAEGPSHGKVVALERVEVLREKISDQEQGITLGCLVATLKFEQDEKVRGALLHTLMGFSQRLSESRDSLVTLVRWLVQALAEEGTSLSSPARKLFLSPEMASSSVVVEVLWEELEGIRTPSIRSFFQVILCGQALDAGRKEALALQISQDLATLSIEDLSAARLAEAMTLLGDEALKALHKTLGSVSEDSLSFYLKMVDAAASMEGIDPELRNRTGEIFLETLKTASRSVRGVIMEAELCGHPALSPDLKKKLCIDIVRNLHLLRSDQLVEATVTILIRMGGVVSSSLQKLIRDSAYPVEREVAARALVEIAMGESKANEIFPFFRSLESETLLPVGMVVRAVGRLCSHPDVDGEKVEEVYRDYSAKVGNAEHRFDLIAALGWVAASPRASRQMAADIALQLIRLFDCNLPSPGVTRSDTEEGPMFVLGEETEVYTDLLPDVIGGVARLVCSGKLAPGVCVRTTDRLLEKYDAVMEYREVWAPGNVVELGEALSRIARYDHTSSEVRKKILETLLRNARNLATARILSEVFSGISEDSDPFAVLAETCVEKLFELRDHPAYQEMEDRRVLLSALGRMALVPSIGLSEKNGIRWKTRAVEALLEEAGPGYPEGNQVLRALAQSSSLPSELVERITAAGRIR